MRILSAQWPLLLSVSLGALLFALDARAPGFHLWARYLLPLIIVYFWGQRKAIYPAAAYLSLLMAASLVLEERASPGDLFSNHLLPLLVLWAFAWLAVQRRQAQEVLAQKGAALAEQVRVRTAELQASEQRYRLLAENAKETVWAVDMEARLTYASPSVAQLRGYSREELLAMGWEARLEAGFPARMLEALHAGLADLRAGRPMAGGPLVIPSTHRDGTQVWIEAELSPLYDDAGRPIGLRGSARNVTTREQALLARRHSEERFAKMFHSSPAGMVLTRRCDGRYLDANDAFLAITGYSRAELIGRTSVELGIMSPAVRSAKLALLAGQSQLAGIDLQIGSKGGATLDVLYATETVEIEGEPCLLSSVIDITDRKRMEQALRRSEERFAHIFHASPAGIVLRRIADGRYLDANKAFLDLIGYQKHEVCGRDATEIGIITPSVQAAVQAQIQQQEALHELEVELTTRRGETRATVCSFEQMAMGGDSCHLIIVQDITERKRLERELRGLNEELEERVARRTAELQRALADKEQALRLKGEFMAMISHELRTPLTGVLTMAELLEEQIGNQISERQHLYLDMIQQSGERLLSIVNSILSYAHLAGGDVQIQREHCALEYLLDVTAQALHGKAGERQQTITVEVNPPELALESDPEALVQILKRLLDNAIKFTPQGGAVGLLAQRSADAAAVQIVVWDTGIGVPQDKLCEIVRPFTQVDGSLARGHEGIGMGLAYAHRMVKLLGGRLEIQSEPGCGSRFTITLPTGPAELSPHTNGRRRAGLRLGSSPGRTQAGPYSGPYSGHYSV